MTTDLRRVTIVVLVLAVLLAVLLETSALSLVADVLKSAFGSLNDDTVHWDAPRR